MSDIAICVENLGKRYRIGERQHYKALRDTLANALYAPVRAATSLFNGHHTNGSNTDGNNHFWSLKDVSFDVKQGEAVGVIGRNGAGKSTMLKILSRITKPTEGYIRIRGRVGSLLEVGTGFHPELTGRENTYLNGAIIGMKKKEIDRKFDEIVAFAEIQKFIDTPVKFYSSGMYIRLAFAVAAHLEPEILLVDEVLAVGDAAFQKKCLGKMGDVAKQGRTILFVSHNMSAVMSLCSRAILLKAGQMVCDLPPADAIQRYMARDGHAANSEVDLRQFSDVPERRKFAQLHSLRLRDQRDQPTLSISIGDGLVIELTVQFLEPTRQPEVGTVISTPMGERIVRFVSTWEGLTNTTEAGTYVYTIRIPELMLVPGHYTITPWVKRCGEEVDDIAEGALRFEVGAKDINGHLPYFERYCRPGEFYSRSQWSVRALLPAP